jgi:hypothetical protein
MTACGLRSMPSEASLGIDRLVRNVETKRFERSLSALTGAEALVTVTARSQSLATCLRDGSGFPACRGLT